LEKHGIDQRKIVGAFWGGGVLPVVTKSDGHVTECLLACKQLPMGSYCSTATCNTLTLKQKVILEKLYGEL
jgi:hypothetical protein